MSGHGRRYTVVPFSRMRRAGLDLSVAERRRPIHLMLEADVTVARTQMRAHRERTGESLSFTAFVTGCVVKAVSENPALQAYRSSGRRLTCFRDVDVTMLMEREISGHKRTLYYIIRQANEKSMLALHREIRAAQAKPAATPGGLSGLTIFVALPALLRRWLIRFARSRPRIWKRFGGTIAITSIGLFGAGASWGIPVTTNTLDVTIGAIAQRPVAPDATPPAVREHLCLTLTADGDIVNMSMLSRFAYRVSELLESAHGLSAAEPVTASSAHVAREDVTAISSSADTRHW